MGNGENGLLHATLMLGQYLSGSASFRSSALHAHVHKQLVKAVQAPVAVIRVPGETTKGYRAGMRANVHSFEA